jgi:hypothetical protein
MNNNSNQPKTLEHLDSECESATHYCGQCGRKYDFGDLAPLRSPCCSVVCHPLQGGPRFALGGLPNEGGKETIYSYLRRGAPPGVKR